MGELNINLIKTKNGGSCHINIESGSLDFTNVHGYGIRYGKYISSNIFSGWKCYTVDAAPHQTRYGQVPNTPVEFLALLTYASKSIYDTDTSLYIELAGLLVSHKQDADLVYRLNNVNTNDFVVLKNQIISAMHDGVGKNMSVGICDAMINSLGNTTSQPQTESQGEPQTQVEAPVEEPVIQQTAEQKRAAQKDKRKEIQTKLDKFFSEFALEACSIRLTNTIAHTIKGESTEDKGRKAAIEYVSNYFECQQHPRFVDIQERLKSPEWAEICKSIFNDIDIPPLKVNRRLKVLFGPPGMGKSTIFEMSHPNSLQFNCTRSMNPEDLWKKLDLKDSADKLKKAGLDEASIEATLAGVNNIQDAVKVLLPILDKIGEKPTFIDTEISKSIKQGVAVRLEEFAELQEPCQTALQPILDNHEYAETGFESIKIPDSWEVLASFNLYDADGTAKQLTAAIVDRAAVIKKYIPKAADRAEIAL